MPFHVLFISGKNDDARLFLSILKGEKLQHVSLRVLKSDFYFYSRLMMQSRVESYLTCKLRDRIECVALSHGIHILQSSYFSPIAS